MSNKVETMKKKSKRTLTPKLRFPKFRDRPYHNVRLGDVAEEATERNRKTLDADVVMGVFKGEGMRPMEKRLVSKNLSRYKVVENDWFAYNPMRLNIGSIARWSGDESVLVSPDYIVFRCSNVSNQKIDPNYLDHFRYSDQWERFVNLSGDGSVRVRIYFRDLATLPLTLPCLREQQKIANCLSSLDGLIAAEDRKLEALRDHKRGLMQQLFPQPGQNQPRLRFPEFEGAGEWEEKPLNKMAKFASGGTPSKTNPKFWDGDIPWISASAMHDTAVYDSELRVTHEAIGNGTRLAPKGSILILVRGSMLFKRVPICFAERNVAFNQDVKSLRPKRGVVTRYLLYHLIASESRIAINSTGIGAGKIDTEHLKSLIIGIPSSVEQEKIADCLTSLDTLIAAQAAKLGALKTHKSGLMQQLFPAPEEQ